MSHPLRRPPALAAVLLMVLPLQASASKLDELLRELGVIKPSVSFTQTASATTEGGSAQIQLRLSEASRKQVTVNLSLGGTASSGSDYLSPGSQVVFASGETQKTLSVRTLDDSAVEGSETLTLTLASASNANLGEPKQHTLTIADNDVAPPTVAFSAASSAGSESEATRVDLVLSRASSKTVTVSYSRSGTAGSGDYGLNLASPVSFAPGETRRTLLLTPVDDSEAEPGESAVLTLTAATEATLGNVRSHTRSISDNDGGPVAGKWVMGYYVGYARDLYPLEVVDFSAMTHVAVGAVLPNSDGTLATHFYIDNTQGPQWAKSVVAKAHQQGTLAIAMIGGAGTYDGFVAAASDANRARFVQNLVALAAEYGFDGFDLDWEPIADKDKPNLKKLAEELRAAAPGKLITFPIGWINANFPQEADPWFGQHAYLFDQINVMSYDMASGFWGWDTWHSSAIYGETPRTPSSVDSTVRLWRQAGIPAEKLGVGIGFFGSCWRGVTEPYQSTSGANTGGLPINGNSDNAMSYTNIMTQYHSPSVARWHEAAKAPYLSSSTPLGPQKCNFVSYEDPQSIAEKALYVKQNGLGGAIVWQISEGYLPNAPEGQRDPLMKALKDHFLSP